MIKAKKGQVELVGKEDELLTELTLIVKSLKASGIKEDYIDMAIKIGKTGNEKEMKKMMAEMLLEKFSTLLGDELNNLKDIFKE